MAFNFEACLAAAAGTVADITKQGVIDLMKADIEKEKMRLGNELSMRKESFGRAEEFGYKTQLDTAKYGHDTEENRDGVGSASSHLGSPLAPNQK